MDRVKNTSQGVVDLAGGRQLGPGETAEGVDVTEAHNAALVTDGRIRVMQAPGADDDDSYPTAPAGLDSPAPSEIGALLVAGDPADLGDWLERTTINGVRTALDELDADQQPDAAAALADVERSHRARQTLLDHLDAKSAGSKE